MPGNNARTANINNVHKRHNAAKGIQKMEKNILTKANALEIKLRKQLKEFQKSLKEAKKR